MFQMEKIYLDVLFHYPIRVLEAILRRVYWFTNWQTIKPLINYYSNTKNLVQNINGESPIDSVRDSIFSLIESTTILPSHLNHAGDWFKTNFVKFGKTLSTMRNFCSEKNSQGALFCNDCRYQST